MKIHDIKKSFYNNHVLDFEKYEKKYSKINL